MPVIPVRVPDRSLSHSERAGHAALERAWHAAPWRRLPLTVKPGPRSPANPIPGKVNRDCHGQPNSDSERNNARAALAAGLALSVVKQLERPSHCYISMPEIIGRGKWPAYPTKT